MTKSQSIMWILCFVPFALWVYRTVSITPPHKILMLSYGALFFLNGYNSVRSKITSVERVNSIISLIFSFAVIGLLYFGITYGEDKQ